MKWLGEGGMEVLPLLFNNKTNNMQFTDEIWKDIPCHDGYMVSNLGRIKRFNKVSPHSHSGTRILKERIMSAHRLKIKDGRKENTGYLRVSFCYKGKNIKYFVHRLVANAFVAGKTETRQFVNHIDGNKHNNHFSNLEWVTSKENFNHAVSLGLINLVQTNLALKRLTIN